MPYKSKKKHADYMREWRRKKKAQIEKALDELRKVDPQAYKAIFGNRKKKPKR